MKATSTANNATPVNSGKIFMEENFLDTDFFFLFADLKVLVSDKVLVR